MDAQNRTAAEDLLPATFEDLEALIQSRATLSSDELHLVTHVRDLCTAGFRYEDLRGSVLEEVAQFGRAMRTFAGGIHALKQMSPRAQRMVLEWVKLRVAEPMPHSTVSAIRTRARHQLKVFNPDVQEGE